MAMRILGSLVLGLLAASTLGSETVAFGGDDRPASPINRGIGQRMPDFTLRTATGDTSVRLYSYARLKKQAVVLVFTGTACPVAEVYLPRLNEMAKAYDSKGVVFLAINSNHGEPADDVALHAKEHSLGFTVLKDPKNLVADLALAERTPEVVVLDGKATIRYRGAIDDQYVVGARKPEPTRHYLRDALDAVLAGKPVEVAATAVEGCPIDRVEPVIAAPKGPRVRPAQAEVAAAYSELEKNAGAIKPGKVTYAADVAPIVQAKCQTCHRPTQSAPFSLLGYDDVRRHSARLPRRSRIAGCPPGTPTRGTATLPTTAASPPPSAPRCWPGSSRARRSATRPSFPPPRSSPTAGRSARRTLSSRSPKPRPSPPRA